MQKINISPPANFMSFSPSELFKFYFQIGHWTEESFSSAFQSFTRGKLVSTVTINSWKNKDVIPTRYSGAFLRMVESVTEPGLAKDWVTAFETVWALHTAGRTESKTQTKAENFDDSICAQHRNWIEQLYSEKPGGTLYAPLDIYVPIQLSEVGTVGAIPQDIEDIIDIGHDWNFISGGPGAGKSMAALHLAYTLCQGDIFPIYIRGSHLSNIDIDIIDPHQSIGDSFSIKSFLKHFRASHFDKACLILDGLDEINRGSQGSIHALSQLITELKIEQAACAAHEKSLRVVALGRQAHIEFADNHLSSDESRRFVLRALDGSARHEVDTATAIQGQDLRSAWWDKYLNGNGHLADPSLPDFLSTAYDDFFEFGGDPLLTYLICQSSLENQSDSSSSALPHERVNAFTYSSNKNIIYKTIVDRQAQSVRHLLDAKQFISVLQHMAMAVWHEGTSRHVSLKRIYEQVHAADIKAAFLALNLTNAPTQTPPELLITAFYYHLSQDDKNSGQGIIEFTHKTFVEYLTCTLVFNSFTALVTAYHQKAEFETALKDWMRVSSKGTHDPSLADFCQNEAAIRFENFSDLDWDTALTIIRNHIRKTKENYTVSELQTASSLLFFIWSCLNLERQRQTGARIKLSHDGPNFNSSDLKTIQRPNGLHLKATSIVEPILRDLTFLTPSLSALHLTFADMSQLSFSIGHIENLLCEDTSFAMTHWSHVKVTRAEFRRTFFQQAIFHQWQVLDTYLSHCLIQGSRFQGAIFSNCEIKETIFSQCHFTDVEFLSTSFENVTFDRCVFSQSIFSADCLLGVQFRHCTFLDMDIALKNIPPENIINSISKMQKPDITTALKTFI